VVVLVLVLASCVFAGSAKVVLVLVEEARIVTMWTVGEAAMVISDAARMTTTTHVKAPKEHTLVAYY
jgi:hypothetical protein